MKFHISLLDVLNSRTKLKIVKFLLAHEASMSEREIAAILKVSHMSVNRTMRELADLNFVDFIAIGKAHLWKVNKRSHSYKVFSELINCVSGIKEPLENLKTTLLRNIPRTLIKKVVLFGSIADGSERVNSDIDVFMLIKNNQDKEKLESFIEKLSNMFFELYGNRLAPYILTEKELNQKKNLRIISDIEKGIQIFPERKG